MIDLEKIEEWIREVEERPSSAPMIIRYIANRLSELTKRNEALLAENIELRTDKKVDDYESRIANLDYQVGLLKRQLEGLVTIGQDADRNTNLESANLFFYNPKGQVLRASLPVGDLVNGEIVANLSGNEKEIGLTPRFLVTGSHEELLLIYDSGRAVTISVVDIPTSPAKSLSWAEPFTREPRSNETLSTIVPVGRMSLYEFAIQVSRRGYTKKIIEKTFESFIANNYIGSGIKATPDKPCGLVFARKEDWLVLVSQEGFVLCVEISRLPFAAEEVLHLNPTDHIETAMVIPKSAGSAVGSSILVITDSGKVINRDDTWLEPIVSFRTRGQSLISKDKRSTGVKVLGAGFASQSNWGFAYHAGGQVTAHLVSELSNSGIIAGGDKQGEAAGMPLVGFDIYTTNPAR